jgi:hypothetical protein
MQQRTDPAAIEAEIALLRLLALDALRRRWRHGTTPFCAPERVPCAAPVAPEDRGRGYEVAKGQYLIDDLAHGRVANFAVIAGRERKAERHIRLLAPLAFLSPRIVSALLDGTAPADLTLTQLARALPHSWAAQERRVGFCSQPIIALHSDS